MSGGKNQKADSKQLALRPPVEVIGLDEIEEPDYISQLNLYVSFSFLIVIASFIILVFCYYMGLYFDVNSTYNSLKGYLDYFTLSPEFIGDIIDKLGYGEALLLFFGAFIAYTYLFQYIKKKGVNIYEGVSDESKYFLSFYNIWALFEFFILLVLIVYLLTGTVNYRYTQLFLVVAFFLLNIFLISKIPTPFIKILLDYELLDILNAKNILPTYNKKLDQAKLKLNNEKISDTLKNLILFSEFIKMTTQFIMFSYIRVLIPRFLNLMFASTIVITLIGFIFHFNLLTVIYIELLLLIWYSNLCLLQYIPTNQTAITLDMSKARSITSNRNGSTIVSKMDEYIINGYVLEDNDNYIGVLIKNNEPAKPQREYVKIMKGAIAKISYDITPVLRPNVFKNMFNFNIVLTNIYNKLDYGITKLKNNPETSIELIKLMIDVLLHFVSAIIEMSILVVLDTIDNIKNMPALKIVWKGAILAYKFVITVLVIIAYYVNRTLKSGFKYIKNG